MRLLVPVTDIGTLVTGRGDDVMGRRRLVFDGKLGFTTCPASCALTLLLLRRSENTRLESTCETRLPQQAQRGFGGYETSMGFFLRVFSGTSEPESTRKWSQRRCLDDQREKNDGSDSAPPNNSGGPATRKTTSLALLLLQRPENTRVESTIPG